MQRRWLCCSWTYIAIRALIKWLVKAIISGAGILWRMPGPSDGALNGFWPYFSFFFPPPIPFTLIYCLGFFLLILCFWCFSNNGTRVPKTSWGFLFLRKMLSVFHLLALSMNIVLINKTVYIYYYYYYYYYFLLAIIYLFWYIQGQTCFQ
jgi:hypothetical protein